MNVADARELVLPPHARLLHIGSPKTGTTALQNAMSKLRGPLLEHGVRYPGTTLHHQYGASVLLGRRSPAWGGAEPPQQWWDDLQAEIDAETQRRVLVSYEMICQGDLTAVQRFRDALGPATHAVLVLRSFGTLLPSMWQQRVKMGLSQTIDGFMKVALADLDAIKIEYSDAFHRNDGLHLVERWARVLGPENVTVVVLDPKRRSLLFDAFEGLLDLPDGLLSTAKADGFSSNRSMSLAETELVRSLNAEVLDVRHAPRAEHRRLVWQGAVDRMLKLHVPTPDEGRVAIPSWAQEPCQEAGRRLADVVRAQGVRVYGDLDVLSAPSPVLERDTRALMPIDAAAEAVLGALAGALDRPVTMKPRAEALSDTHPLVQHERLVAQRYEQALAERAAAQAQLERAAEQDALRATPVGELLGLVGRRAAGSVRRRISRTTKRQAR